MLMVFPPCYVSYMSLFRNAIIAVLSLLHLSDNTALVAIWSLRESVLHQDYCVWYGSQRNCSVFVFSSALAH